MYRFTYDQGTWNEGMPLPELGDDEQHSDYFQRIGYSPYGTRMGNEGGIELELHESNSGRAFYAVVTPAGNAVYDVYLPNFPSLMQFLKDYGPAFTLTRLRTDIEELSEAFRKLFHALHGHDAYTFCKKCDPKAWEEAQAHIRRWSAGQD